MAGRADSRGSTDPVGVMAGISAILLLCAGVVHVSAAADHSDEPVMLVGFLVVATLQLVFGGELLRHRPSRLFIVAAVVLTVGSIGAWLLSRTVGLPLVPHGHKEPVGFKDAVCVLFEVVSVPTLLLLGTSGLARMTWANPPALSGVGAVSLALVVPAVMVAGHTHPKVHEMAAMHASASHHARHAAGHGEHAAHAAHAGHTRHAAHGGHAAHGAHAAHAAHVHPAAHQHAIAGHVHPAGAPAGHDHAQHTRHTQHTEHAAHHHHHHAPAPAPGAPAATAATNPAAPPPDQSGEPPVRVTGEPSVCVTDICVP